jgi:dynamin 1-like protein
VPLGFAQLCRQFEEAFAKSVDGGKGGGEQILLVFEKRLTENIRKLNFDKILDPANVKRIVEEADGYQPHLIAPEMGYRRLLQVLIVHALIRTACHRREATMAASCHRTRCSG